MATSLVTGGSGFIGSHLVEALLARGDQVRCLVRGSSRTDHLESLGVELVRGDLSDANSLRDAVAGAERVFHLAGLTYALRARQLDETNIVGTHNIANACARAAEPPTLVLVSSLAAAGPSIAQCVRREEDPPRPISNYGRSKRGAERAAQQFADTVPTTVVRPGIVFGPRDPETLLMFRPIARFGVHMVPRYSPPRVSLIFVRDLAQLLIQAAEQGKRIAPASDSNGLASGNYQGFYFACADQFPDYRQLGKMLGQATGRKSVIMVYMAEPMLLLAAGASEAAGWLVGKPNIFNLDKVREATATGWVASGEKACRELGFSAGELSGQLRETADWYRAQGWF